MAQEHSSKPASTNFLQNTDDYYNEPEEDVLNVPIYPEKDNKSVYKVILERGQDEEYPSELDKVVLEVHEGSEKFTRQLDLAVESKDLSTLIQSMKKNELSELYTSDQTLKARLIDWTMITDILEDGSLIKTLVQKGEGYDYVEFKDDVKLKLKIYQGDKEYLSEEREYYCEVPQIPLGLFEICKYLKLKEQATIKVKHEYYKANFDGLPEIEAGDVFIDITLLDLNKVEDMYLDGAFYRKTITKGHGESTPNENAIVKILYRLEINGAVALENTEQELLCTRMDEEEIPTVWAHSLKQMKEGELVKVECNMDGRHSHYLNDGLIAKYNYNSYKIPEINTGILYLTLVRIEMGEATLDMTYEGRVVEANRIKEVGNKLFKLGRFDKALEKYENANSSLEPITDYPFLLRPVHLLLYGNITLCYLKIEKFHEAETHARKILEINPNDIKALYRRGLARIGLQNFEAAFQDLKNARELCEEKADKEMLAAVNKEIQRISAMTKESRAKEKAMYKNLFNK